MWGKQPDISIVYVLYNQVQKYYLYMTDFILMKYCINL